MTRDEVLAVLTTLRVAYPQFYKAMGRADAEATVALWHRQFAENNPAQVMAAVDAFIATDDKGFPPHIGAIKASIAKLASQGVLGEGEAWALVRKAIGNSFYNAKQEFDKLPDSVKRAVGSPSVLTDWGQQSVDDLSVIQSNFQRSYRARVESARYDYSLPDSIKLQISKIGLLPEGIDEKGTDE